MAHNKNRAERVYKDITVRMEARKTCLKKPRWGKNSAGNLGRNHGLSSKWPFLQGYTLQTSPPALTKIKVACMTMKNNLVLKIKNNIS